MTDYDSWLEVKLTDLNENDPIPQRTVILQAPSWTLKIGRGTHNADLDLRPAEENAWFDSRVMSRNHATLKADFNSRQVTLKDDGSMHGTHVAGRRLKCGSDELLYENDTIRFGADVSRGTAYFPALEIMVSFRWSDEEPKSTSQTALTKPSPNSFHAYYSDEEEAAYLDETHETDHSVDHPSIEVARPGCKFAVPDSEISETRSCISDDLSYNSESPSSSPLGLNDQEKEADLICIEKPSSQIAQNPSDVAQIEGRISLSHTVPDGVPTLSRIEVDLRGTDSEYYDSDIFDEDPFAEDDTSAPPSPNTKDSGPEVTISSMLGPETNHAQHDLISLDQGWSAREPSPSDAAMAKPVLSELRSPPFDARNRQHGHSPIPRPADSAFLGDAVHRLGNAWAGHNSVLYEPMSVSNFENFPSAPESWNQPPLATSYDLTPNAETFYQSVSRPGFTLSSQPSQEDVSEMCVTERIYPYDGPYASILDDTFKLKSPTSGIKRKAAHISEISATELSTADQSSLALDPSDTLEKESIDRQLHRSSGNPRAMSNSANVAETLESIKSPALPTEPARKKLRRTKADENSRKSKKGSNFAKYAATAVVGAAIGVVGTIFGLVALPQDYFV